MAQDPFGVQDQADAAGSFGPLGGDDPFFGPDPSRDAPLARTLQQAQGVQPDRAARILRLQGKTGLPAPVIDRNLDTIERQADTANFDAATFRRTNPLLAEWLASDQYKAALAQDDHAPLGTIERLLGIGRNVAGAAGAGLLDFAGGLYGIPQAAGDVVGAPALAGESARKAQYLRDLAAKTRGPQTGAGFIEQSIYGGIESLGDMAPALLLGVYSGSTALLSSIGLTTGGQTYSEARAQGQTVGKSLTAGSIQGAVEVATEFIPAHRLLGDLAAKSGLLKTLAHQLVPEIAGEEVATVLQDLNEWAFLPANKDKTFADYLRERPSAAAATAISTLVAVGATTTAAHGAQRFIERLGAAAQESATLKRSPETVADVVDHLAKQTGVDTVYAPIQTFTTYWQGQGVDPREMATKLTGNRGAYDTAVATGEDLAIPMGAYVREIAGTDHNAFFANEVRLAPEQMNARETEQFAQAMQEAAQQQADATTAAATDAPVEPSPIQAALLPQLEAAGFTGPTAQAYATLYEAAFTTLGQRAGLDPVALFNRYGLTISREGLNRAAQSPTATVPTVPPEAAPAGDAGVADAGAANAVPASADAGRAGDAGVAGSVEFNQAARPADLATLKPAPGPNESRAVPFPVLDAQTSSALFRAADLSQAQPVTVSVDDLVATQRTVSDTVVRQKLAQETADLPLVLAYEGKYYLADGTHRATAAWANGRQDVQVLAAPVDAAKLSEADQQTLRQQPTTFYQGERSATGITQAEVDAFAVATKEAFGRDLEGFRLILKPNGDLFLASLIVARKAQKQGIGSRAMEALTRFADSHGLRLVLTPAQPGDIGPNEPTSTGRLVRFYKRFGFVENKGKRADFSLDAGMYREPSTLLKQGERGAIRIGGDRQMDIALFEGADLSTFLHESGHFFLEVLRDLNDEITAADPSTLTDQQRQLAGDYATLLAWFGSEDIGRDQHEQFARGFEAYLMDGEAPSSALRAAFARFRSWLVGIYRSLRGLNVDLTPEVRRVFDRLLASDAAIDQAMQDGALVPLIDTAAEAERFGMSPEAYATYAGLVADAREQAQRQLADRVLADLQREQKAWWREEREKVRAAVDAEFSAQPVYLAWSGIQKGTQPDGAFFAGADGPVPMKLDKAALAARYTAEELAVLRRRQLYAVEGGFDPDLVADTFGFSSGDELVRALLEAPPLKAAVQAETDKRMRAAHGDLMLDDAALREQAEQAVLDQRETVVRAELAALSKGLAGVAPLSGVLAPASVFKQAAETRLAQMRERDVRPGQFLMAAQRASREAFNLRESNRAGAVKAKQQELLSLALYRAALAAKDDAQKAVAHAKRLTTPAAQARLGKAGESYQDQVNGILARFELATVPLRSLDRRTALVKWVAAQEAEGWSVDLPDHVLDEAQRRNWRELTIEQLRGINDSLTQIEHLARLKNRLLTEQGKRELSDRALTVATRVKATLAGAAPAVRLTRSKPMLDKVQRYGRDLAGAFLLPDTLLRELDGFEELGPVYSAIKGGIDHQIAHVLLPRTHVVAQELARINDAYKPGELQKVEFIPALDDSLTREEMIVIALNWGTAENRAALLESKKFAAIGANEGTVNAILDRLEERDWTYVRAVWQFIGSFWPEIKESQQRRKGIAPEKVDGVPVQTKFGTFDGAYYPLKYDPEDSIPTSQDAIDDVVERMRLGRYAAAATRAGFAHERVGSGGRPVLLSLGVIQQHVTEVLYDIIVGDAIRDADRVLRHPIVREAFESTQSREVYQALQLWLHDVASRELIASDPLSRLFRWTRIGLSVSKLAWNLGTVLAQPLGLAQTAVVVGKRHTLHAIIDLTKAKWDGANNIFEQITDASPFMASRLDGEFNKDLSDAMRSIRDSAVVPQWVGKSMFYLIGKAQALVDVITWLAAHRKGMVQFEGDTTKAAAFADSIVKRSQASGLWSDRAAIERGTVNPKTRQAEYVRIWTTLASYMIAKGSVAYERTRSTDFRNPVDGLKWAVDMALLFTLEAAVMGVVRNEFDDDDDLGSIFLRLLKMTGGNILSLFPIAREAGSEIEGFRGGGPIGATASAIGKVAAQIGQGELDAALVRSVVDVGGIFFHYPSTAINRVISAGTRQANGEHVPLIDYVLYRKPEEGR